MGRKRRKIDALEIKEDEQKETQQAIYTSSTVKLTAVELPLLGNPKKLEFYEDRNAGHGGILWACGRVLAESLASQPPILIQGKSVVELGAGVGLPSHVACCLGASQVLLTEKPCLVPLLKLNATLFPPSPSTSVHVQQLSWGSSKRRLPSGWRGPYDVILASDVVGCADHSVFPLLLKSLRDLSAKGTVLLLAYKFRAKFEDEFFEGLHTDWERIESTYGQLNAELASTTLWEKCPEKVEVLQYRRR